MPNTGAPGNVWFPDDTAPVAPLEGLFSTQAVSINTALTQLASPIFPDKATLDAAPGTTIGQHATVNGDATAKNNGDYTWSGTQWVSTRFPFGFEQSWVSVPIGTSGSSWIVLVNFTAGTFTQTPNVFLTLQTSPGIGRKLVTQAVGVSTTGFQCVVSTGDGSNPGAQTAAVAWMAVQAFAGSAYGAR